MILTDAQKAIPALTSGISAGKKYKLRDGTEILLREFKTSEGNMLMSTDLKLSPYLYCEDDGWILDAQTPHQKDITAEVTDHV